MSGTKLSPHTHPHRMSGTKLSPLAQNGSIWRCFCMQGEFCTVLTTKKPSRENFVPFSPPRSRAGRVLYRMRGRTGASHDSTPGTTSAKGTGGPRGTGRGAGCRLAGPSWVGRTTARRISHAIRLGQISTNPENVAIPTMQIQYLNKLLGNCMRNYYGGGDSGAWLRCPWATAGPGCGRLVGPARVRRATARQISHAIRLGQISTNPENVAIPTMQIQYLNKLLGNCMRNYYGGGDSGAWLRCPWAGAGPGRTTSRRTRPRHISHIISHGHFWR